MANPILVKLASLWNFRAFVQALILASLGFALTISIVPFANLEAKGG